MERRRIVLGADLVVVRGLSGIMVATAMSLLHKTPIAVVRKPTELSHGNSIEMVEYGANPIEYNKWMIVDDLIDSGKTVKEIHDAIIGRDSVHGECVGIALYYDDEASVGTHTIDNRAIPKFHIGSLT